MSLVWDLLTDSLAFDYELGLFEDLLPLFWEPPSLRAMAELINLDWAACITSNAA